MTKIEITAAMVERAIDASWIVASASSRQQVRTMLDAALNPPPEPEIEVMRQMSLVGARAYNEYLMVNHQPVKPEERAFVDGIAAAYRAMRAFEPKPHGCEKVVIGGETLGFQGHRRIHSRASDTDCFYAHRRAGDPK